MILFPAIDLKDGQCVRLKLGDMEQATVFNDDPAAQARSFQNQGFDWLQVLLAATYSGAFHPTAEGQAAIADAIVDKARGVIEKYDRTAGAPGRRAER